MVGLIMILLTVCLFVCLFVCLLGVFVRNIKKKVKKIKNKKEFFFLTLINNVPSLKSLIGSSALLSTFWR